MVAPAGTPEDIVAKIHREVIAILHTPEVSRKLAADGAELSTLTPQEFAAYIRSETAKWRKVVQASGARLD
jgi:tripartite-type tricarboxylate transporter receptor subunit TctC